MRSWLALLIVGVAGCVVDPPIDPRAWALAPAEDLDADDDVVEVALHAREADIALLDGDGPTTRMWTYDGLVPGPLLEAKVGDRVIVHVDNEVDEPTTIHWHGLRIAAEMDGVPAMQDPIEPGESFTYDFVVPDALLAWYHPHMRSDVQVERGLQGAFLVRDADPAADAARFGRETVIVLDDIRLDGDDQLAPFGTDGEAMAGRTGGTLLVNGHRHPMLEVRRGEPQLLRIVNTANARTMLLHVPGHTLTWLGTDGGLLEAPVDVDTLSLSPGERADLLLTLDDAVGVETDLEVGPARDGQGGGMAMMGMGGDGATYRALRIRVVDGAPQQFDDVPQLLRDVPTLDTGRARTLTFDGMGMSGGGGGGGMGSGMGFTIDGERWPDVTPLRATVGDVEEWTLDNRTGMAHPFHLHGNRFQVLDDALDVGADVRGWKDDVLVPAHTAVRLAVELDGAPGMWMYHCHILEHAEGGMMGELELEPRDAN